MPAKKYIHVSAKAIERNRVNGTTEPVLSVREGIDGEETLCREVVIDGPSVMCYRPDNPLPSGARVWLETFAEVTTITS